MHHVTSRWNTEILYLNGIIRTKLNLITEKIITTPSPSPIHTKNLLSWQNKNLSKWKTSSDLPQDSSAWWQTSTPRSKRPVSDLQGGQPLPDSDQETAAARAGTQRVLFVCINTLYPKKKVQCIMIKKQNKTKNNNNPLHKSHKQLWMLN